MSMTDSFRNMLILRDFADARRATKETHREAHSHGMGLLAGLYHSGVLTPEQYNNSMDFLCNCILNRLNEINQEESRNE